MKAITPETTVGEIVRSTPAQARVFEKLGIDYCCGGKRPLAEACKTKSLNTDTVVAMLSAMNDTPDVNAVNLEALSLSVLCDHIEQFHHAYLSEELPRLDFMTRKVAAVHGDREPRLQEVRRTFEAFNTEITAHTREEDESVFPAIRLLDSGDRSQVAISFKDSFTKLESEHDTAGAALVQFRKLTCDYTPPDWACNTFRALFDGLEQLEKNTHQHVHIENNILFPRVRAALQELPDGTDEVKFRSTSPVCYLEEFKDW